MKQKLNRLLALVLCALMMTSDLTGFITPAQAAPAAPTVPNQGGIKDQFQDETNGRPNLFVDFLGDNNGYLYTQNGANAGVTKLKPAATLNDLPIPAPYDQEWDTNLTGPGNKWSYYVPSECVPNTVFWVGLGVDRVELLELLEGNEGLASLETGFYYDSQVIEPYYDATLAGPGDVQGAYLATLEKANINNPNYPKNTQWNSNYKILRAETDLPVETDRVTQEELASPSMDEILSNSTTLNSGTKSQWKMTYVSLELKDIDTPSAGRRLNGRYKGADWYEKAENLDPDGNVVLPPSAAGDGTRNGTVTDPEENDYQYLMLIPFRLKAYGSPNWTPIRLARNATHFSIGGGWYGVDPYGAWEKVTTRNPATADHSSRDIKLLTRFLGDLNLFTSGRTPEKNYSALLLIENGGGAQNTAVLKVDGDPSVWPVWADTDGDVINGLRSGLGMRLDVSTAPGYKATVYVSYECLDVTAPDGKRKVDYAYTTVTDQKLYTFVMPEFVPPIGSLSGQVTVRVVFARDDGTTYAVYLSEIPQPMDADHKVGNETVIRTNLASDFTADANTNTINSYSPPYTPHPNVNHPGMTHAPGPMTEAEQDEWVEVNVTTHEDYKAVVRIYDFKSEDFIISGFVSVTSHDGTSPDIDNSTIPDPTPGAPAGSTIHSPDWGKITLNRGGVIRFRKSPSDIDVEVTYEPAEKRQATLEVWHTDGVDVTDLNTAQLIYDQYDALNAASKAYSGVVYELKDDTVPVDDHRALKDPAKKLPWVARSEASLSGSLGGDTGRTGRAWAPDGTNPDPVTGADTIMAILGSAANEAALRDRLTALDLRDVVIDTLTTGLSSDVYGALFGDKDTSGTPAQQTAREQDFSTMAGLETILWELKTRIEADTATGGLRDTYVKTVPRSATDPTIAYTYLDLTPAQVQAYLLEIYLAQETQRTNELQYRLANRQYEIAKAHYDRLDPSKAGNAVYTGLALPQAPFAPWPMKVTGGVREYQGADYQNTVGYLDNYLTYITAYQTYIQGVEDHGGVSGGPTLTATAPARQSAIQMKIKDDAMAKLYLSMHPYKTTPVPTETTLPGHTIATREGRTVYVALEADSAYEVKSVRLYERRSDGTAGNLITTTNLVPVRSGTYQNLYSFVMPDQDCVVRVTYGLRETMKLQVTVIGAADEPDNLATVVAYQTSKPPQTTPTQVTVDNANYTTKPGYTASTDTYRPPVVEDVFAGSKVTVTLKVADGYKIEKLEVKNRSDTTNVLYTPALVAGTDGAGTYTFTVPAARDGEFLDLTITYAPEDLPKNIAWIEPITDVGVDYDSRNDARWKVVNNSGVTTHPYQQNDVPMGKLLEGEITVAPGYYIYAITASGANDDFTLYTGNYPFTVTGNGYNNGYGTYVTGTNVPVKLEVEMPGENLKVDVIFRKGTPPPEPAKTLTVIVKDDDNTETDPSKAAQNWAQATVYEPDKTTVVTTLPTRDPDNPAATDYLGKHADYGNGALYDRKFVDTGKWVKVDFHPQVVMKDGAIDVNNSYYVDSVTVAPSNLGAAMVWESPTSVSLYMPSGSTSVVVEFKKYPASGQRPSHILTVRETYIDLNATPTPITQDNYNNNYVTQANSETIRGWWGGNAYKLNPYIIQTGVGNPEDVPPTGTLGATGAAAPGEEVTMRFSVNESQWYVQSVALISEGSATRLTDRVDFDHPVSVSGTIKYYDVTFRMPSAAAEFVVHYRRGPKPDVPDYAFTLTLDDADNALDTGTGLYDENNVAASFTDHSGISGVHAPLTVGHNKDSMTAAQHLHAGDIITLKPTVAPGYALEYMIVNPAGLRIFPTYHADGTATFTMPTEGVAVVAKVVKGQPHRYTANLILRYEGPGDPPMSQVGQGTFTSDTVADLLTGTLLGTPAYPQQAIFSTAQSAGTTIDYDLYAFDGYYIDRVTIDPAVGASGTLSGSFGYQDGSFVMPPADVNVNVYFRKGWPDEVQYDLTLKVYDAAQDPDNNAHFHAIAGVDLTAPNSDLVHGGETKTLTDVAYDRDAVMVAIHCAPGFYYNSQVVSVTDSAGDPVPWWYVPGGIAFTQPPRSVTVEVNFKKDDGNRIKRTATLHTENQKTDGVSDPAVENDSAVLSTTAAQATPASVNTDGGVIQNLYHANVLDLSVTPGAKRSVSAAYAVGGGSTVIPIVLDAGSPDFTPGVPGALADPTVPGSTHVPGTPATGSMAMPEQNLDVYVKFSDKEVPPGSTVVNLIASGPAGSDQPAGTAKGTYLLLEEPANTTQNTTVNAPGMDTLYTVLDPDPSKHTTSTVTFHPNTGDGYDIVKLKVTSNLDGSPVDYDWISVIRDPADLTGSADTWPGTAPAPGIDHPTWIPNPNRQITFQVPDGGVTVHVTYGKVEQTPFKAQIVVNDDCYKDAPTPSRNNAWFHNAVNAALREKLKYATPGTWVDLDLSVHPGYKIEYIKVIPQSFGIEPSLPLGPLYDQNTGFYMPNGDCTVYVKFADDGLEEQSATLVVTDSPLGSVPSNPANYAVISSPRSGAKPKEYIRDPAQSVVARPGVDWVTVDYYWAVGVDSVESIRIVTASGREVLFTQVLDDPAGGHGQITFPMSAENAVVTVTYRHDPQPKKWPVVLHVIDKERDGANPILGEPIVGGGMKNYAQLVYDVGNDTSLIGPDTDDPKADDPVHTVFESTKTIWVSAGKTVDLTAASDLLDSDGNGAVYIDSAYVLYTAGGQMVNMNLQPDPTPAVGFNGVKTGSFTVHPCQNDVYVTLTRKAPDPKQHSVVLMVKSPAADTTSEAGLYAGTYPTWNAANTAGRADKVRANDPLDTHATVTAVQDERITVNVEPAPGYVIDYIEITPLGFPLDTDPDYHFTRVGNTFTFDMPHCNIAITVHLKRSNNQDYTARLHFRQDTGTENLGDLARLSWTPDGEGERMIFADADPANDVPTDVTGNWSADAAMIIKEGGSVTLNASLDAPDVVLSAFVLWGGRLVPLTPALEGTPESVSTTNNATQFDGTATFTMPAGDVDVYLVVTNDPPPPGWQTAVLVATDHSPSVNNSGVNQGDLWNNNDAATRHTAVSTGAPGCAWMAIAPGDDFTVETRPGGGYKHLPPAVLSANDGTSLNLSYVGSSPYTYVVTMQPFNVAVHIDFESNDALELLVEIEDKDNPGNGTVTNRVDVDPAGTTPPTLNLASESAAGAYQIMTGIKVNDQVAFTVTPAPGYSAYAILYRSDGTPPEVLALTPGASGTLTGSFPMPQNNTRLTVTFFRSYTGTLEIEYNTSDVTGQATMTEDSGQNKVAGVRSTKTVDSITGLPNGTTLDAQITSDTDLTGKKVTGLLTLPGQGTWVMSPTADAAGGNDHYTHTINRSDAKITLVLDDGKPDPDDDNYIAAVRTVNKPSGTADPTIANTTQSGLAHGSIWYMGKKGNGMTVGVTVPAGYRVELTTDRALALDGGAATTKTLTATGNTTFVMPAANVQVTVTYVKVEFDLTLRIADTSGVAGNATTLDPAAVLGGTDPLTADGHKATVAAGTAIHLTADPAAGAHIVGALYQTSAGATHWFTGAMADDLPYDTTAGTPAGAAAFPMPSGDTVVTVLYDATDPGPDPKTPYYIASTAKVDATNSPGNQITAIRNITTANIRGTATPLPASSPDWTAAYPADAAASLPADTVVVSFQADPGYTVRVTATRDDNGATLPVIVMGATGGGTATVEMADSNITITVEYLLDQPPTSSPVALQLVKHDVVEDNKAQTGGANFTSADKLVKIKGNETDYAPGFSAPGDPVEHTTTLGVVGDDLRTLANWASGYQVVRMTVAIRKTTPGANPGDPATITETPEVNLPVSRYGTAATNRLSMPPTAADETVVIRVYYGNIYDATLHIVGATGNDTTSAIDNVTYTTAVNASGGGITKPIKTHLDKFEGYQGDSGEVITTTAIPDTAATPKKYLVGVVWESDLTGAADAARVGTTDDYTFTMPQDDVDFYAVYAEEPDDEKDREYIAKVAFDPDSVHTENSSNAVSITNKSNAQAKHGAYWTSAKGGEAIAVTVKVAKGYQAQITQTCADDLPAADHKHPYDYYISRTVFVPNLPLGKDGEFTMPVKSDATVTVKFTKGYDLSLNVTDASLLDGVTVTGDNKVDTAYNATNPTAAEHLKWSSDGTTAAYDPVSHILLDKEGGKRVATAITTYDPAQVKVKVTRTTPFTGTTQLTNSGTPPTTDYPFDMPYEDTTVSVLLQDKDAKDDLLAKVELVGDYTDINGNAATPIVDLTTPVPATSVGTVWTTTSRTNTIDLELTVAKGYVAKIKVRRDDSYYGNENDPSKWEYLDADQYTFTRVWQQDGVPAGSLTTETAPLGGVGITEVQLGFSPDARPANAAFPASISGPQHFRFEMLDDIAGQDTDGDGVDDIPARPACDVTVLVEFVKSDLIPQPFDPRNVKDTVYDRRPSFLNDGFIYGENRGDFATVEIPALIQEPKDGEELFDTDNYDKPASGKPEDKAAANEVTFQFYLYDAAADLYTPLVPGVDVILVPYDTDDAATYTDGDPYNYETGMWNGTEHWHDADATKPKRDFVGSRFKLYPTEPVTTGTGATAVTKRTDGAQKLYEMLNNNGSLEKYTDNTTGTAVTKYRTTLYVTATDAAGGESDYTQVWIRPWFALTVPVVSYGPTHELTGNLYKWMDAVKLNIKTGYYEADGVTVSTAPGAPAAPTTPDKDLLEHYKWDDDQKPDFDGSVVLDGKGSGKWLQLLTIKSADLMGDYTSQYDPDPAKLLDPTTNLLPTTDLNYALELEKAANITYHRIKINLNVNDPANAALVNYYQTDPATGQPDPDTKTFVLGDTVYLFAGDIDQDETTKFKDYDRVYDYLYRGVKWSNLATEPTEPATKRPATTGIDPAWDQYDKDMETWAMSVYNPESEAYRVDLNGDRRITVADLNIVNTLFNYNRDQKDYEWSDAATGTRVRPYGMGEDKSQYVALFSVFEPVEGELLWEDPFWDSLADPSAITAPPLDDPNIAVIGPEVPETPADDPSAGGSETPDPGWVDDRLPVIPADRDEREELPLGEEAVGQVQVMVLP